jgi:hypothetical protein
VKRFCFLVFFLVAGCGHPSSDRVGLKEEDPGVQVLLFDVEVRQYRGSEMRFECRAQKLILDEGAQILQATGGVSARLQNSLWEDRKR